MERAWTADPAAVSVEVFNLTRGRRAARAHTTLVTTTADGALLYETPEPIRRRLLGAPAPAETR